MDQIFSIISMFEFSLQIQSPLLLSSNSDLRRCWESKRFPGPRELQQYVHQTSREEPIVSIEVISSLSQFDAIITRQQMPVYRFDDPWRNQNGELSL